MNILLIFFAIPIAVIILSIIFETYMKSPLKVAGIFFSIFLVVAVYLGGTAEFVIAALVYTLISFLTAYIVDLIYFRKCSRRLLIQNEYRENEEIKNIEPDFGLPSTTNLSNFNEEENREATFNNCYRRYR